MAHRHACRFATAVVAALTLSPAPAVPGTVDLHVRVTEQLEHVRDDLVALRRDLHRHPELSGQERRTAAAVADRLDALGLEVRRGVGGHGVVALLRGGRPGPVAAFRADMDAVRSQAPDPVEFASENPGVRHICGHDIHTTVGVALAEGLAAVRDELPGSVLFLFQPAEERATGARAMIADGAVVDPRPDAVFAFHTSPSETGTIATAPSIMMPGRDRVTVRISGEGDLQALAEEMVRRIDALSTVAPLESQPIGTDFIQAGSRAARGTGPGEWVATSVVTVGTRAASASARGFVEQAVEQLRGEHVGASLELQYEERWIAGVTNDPELTEHAVASARKVLGEGGVTWLQNVVPAFSEDFGSFQERVPGTMFFLGVSNSEKGWFGMPHTPDYVADEEAIFVGARAMAAIIIDTLERGAGS